MLRWPPVEEPLQWDGTWTGQPYAADSLVFYNGSTYRASEDLPAEAEPTADDRWVAVALAGTDGTDAAIAGEVGKAIPFADLVLGDGFTVPSGAAAPQIGMDVGGVVWMRGQVQPAAAGLQTFYTIANLVLRPGRRARIPIAQVDGSTEHLIIEANGEIKITATAGLAFHVDVGFPSGAAFGDARYRELTFTGFASDDDDSPLRSVGDHIVGALHVQGPSATVEGSPLVGFVDDPPADTNWHFEGDGTYTVTNGASSGLTGTVHVNSDDQLTIGSFVPDVPDNGDIRVVLPGLQVTSS